MLSPGYQMLAITMRIITFKSAINTTSYVDEYNYIIIIEISVYTVITLTHMQFLAARSRWTNFCSAK